MKSFSSQIVSIIILFLLSLGISFAESIRIESGTEQQQIQGISQDETSAPNVGTRRVNTELNTNDIVRTDPNLNRTRPTIDQSDVSQPNR